MGGTSWPTTSIRLIDAMRRSEDQVAWERFCIDYAPKLLEFCLKRGLQRADAEDIVQQIFLGVHQSIGDFHFSHERGRFRSWLSTIALRLIWKLQQRRLAQRYPLVDPAELTGLEATQQVILDEINTSIFDLALSRIRPEFDEETWGAFSALWFDEERPQSVAERVGRPVGWVYKAKYRVLQRLKADVRRIAHELDYSCGPE